MNFKSQSLFLAVAAALCAAAPARAISINDDAFVANGGNPANIAGTASNVFDALRNASLAPPFDTVGRIGECTATWLGIEGRYAWLLTAARCVPDTGLVARIPGLSFYNSRGAFAAGFAPNVATSFVHPKRFARPAGVGEAGTDIALVRIVRDPKGWSEPALPPTIHDANAEPGLPLAFVAYGDPQVNHVSVGTAWTGGHNRRAWGEAVADGINEAGHGVFANYQSTGTLRWAAVGDTDAGSAWWQAHDGEFQIVATTSTGTPSQSLGTRVSQYAPWINDLFPGARLASERHASLTGVELANSNYFLSRAFHRTVAFLKSADQPGVWAPTTFISDPAKPASVLIEVPVTHEETGLASHVVLRPLRKVTGCGNFDMHNTTNCGSATQLHLTPVSHLNTHLSAGLWRGRVKIDARQPGGSGIGRLVETIDVDIAYTGQSPAGTFDFATVDMATPTSSVYFTVPAQANASGPTMGVHSAAPGSSLITVQARDAITRSIVPLHLRAERLRNCGAVAMNNAAPCGVDRSSSLKVWVDLADNPTLQVGTRYSARFNVQARAWTGGAVNTLIPVSVNLDLLEP